jgi:hypothetical protein
VETLVGLIIPKARGGGGNCLKRTIRMVQWPRRPRTFNQAVGLQADAM